MSFKLIVALDGQMIYFIEYMKTFQDYIPITKNQLFQYDLNVCEELIAVQNGSWLPDYVYNFPCKISVVNTEQLCDINVEKRVLNELSSVKNKSKSKLTVYDYSTENCNILNRLGFSTIYHPYNSTTDEIKYLKLLHSIEKVYDIGFIGCLSMRRKYILDKLKENNIKVHYFELFGNERDVELAKCKYILNIHYDTHFNIFESIRCNRWVQSGFNVITENSIECLDCQNVFMFPYDSLVESIINLINHVDPVKNLIQYITDCIKPRDTSEIIETNSFTKENYLNLKQDGFMFLHSDLEKENLLEKSDFLKINNTTIIRKNFPLQLEWLKENNTISFDYSNIPIYRRFVPPPIETINHVFIISKLIEATSKKDKNYLEYGVRNGDSVEPVSNLVKNVYAVDISDYTPKNSNIQFFKMFTDTFSDSILNTITFDYAFIDADHSSKQVLIDFINVYKYINTGGYIFLHDTYPCMEMLLRSDYCNDCYLSPIKIRELYPDIQMLTIPINPGLTIIRKN
jgi:hypothetical protein